MTDSLASRPGPGHQRKSAGWARRAAQTGGKRPATYEAAVHGAQPIQQQVAALIRAAREVGDHAIVAKLYAPIRDALRLASIRTDALRDTVEQRCDGAEDVRQTEYDRAPSLVTARVYLKAIDADLGARMDVRRALCAQWGMK